MKREKVKKNRDRAVQMLKKAGISITREEKGNMEVADCGLNDIDRLGLQAIVYVNTNRYCAKEIILFPRQMFPEHSHPPIDAKNPGKQETFRCRWGKLFLYVEGNPTPDPKAEVPETYRPYLTAWKEIILNPGDQYTLSPSTKHWFQAGEKGAIVSEFSSTSIDEKDVFTDPRIQRTPIIE